MLNMDVAVTRRLEKDHVWSSLSSRLCQPRGRHARDTAYVKLKRYNLVKLVKTALFGVTKVSAVYTNTCRDFIV